MTEVGWGSVCVRERDVSRVTEDAEKREDRGRSTPHARPDSLTPLDPLCLTLSLSHSLTLAVLF